MIPRCLEWPIIGLYIVLRHREQSPSEIGPKYSFPQAKNLFRVAATCCRAAVRQNACCRPASSLHTILEVV